MGRRLRRCYRACDELRKLIIDAVICMDSIEKRTSSALILAGGKSSRFGSNKALIPFNGTSLLGFIISQLQNQFTEIIISANRPPDYADFNIPVCTDVLSGAGPIGGLHAGLLAASSEYVFVTACDMPFISEELINLMRMKIDSENPTAAVAGRNGFIEPFHGFYCANLVSEIEECTANGNTGIFSLLKKISPAVIDFQDENIFFNINRPGDLDTLSCI